MQEFASVFGHRRNFINLLFLLLVAVGLPIALYLVTQQQDLRSRANLGDTIGFAGENVTEKDGKVYIKPIAITDPTHPESVQYRYQVALKLTPPSVPATTAELPASFVTQAFAECDVASGNCPPASPSPSPSPSSSPHPAQCAFSDTCSVSLNQNSTITGSTNCVYQDQNACKDPTPITCTVSADSNISGCGLAPNDTSVDIACAPQSSTIGIGEPAVFDVSYAAALSPVVQSVSISDSSGAPNTVDGPGVFRSDRYHYTISRTYTEGFSGKPTVSLLLKNNKGATLPFECGQISVGASSIKADITGDSSISSGQTGNYSLKVEVPDSYSGGGLGAVAIYALHADGSSVTQSECGNARLTNGACQIYANSNFQSLQKSFTKSDIKWKPVLSDKPEQEYYLYTDVQLTGSNPQSCTGKRGTDPRSPCGGDSNFDLIVTAQPSYVGFAVATSLNELNTAPIIRVDNISSWPQQVNFPPDGEVLNSWQSPGPHSIFVRYFSNFGQNYDDNRTVELVGPDPQIRAVSCNISTDGKSLAVTARGNYFGEQAGSKLTLNDTPITVTQWKTNQSSANGSDLIVGSLSQQASSNQTYTVKLTRADGSTAATTCGVGTTTLNIGAKIACRPASAPSLENVELTIADSFDVRDGVKGKSTKYKVAIASDGTVTGLNSILQTCNYYKLSIKAPFSLRRDVSFQAADGTTNIPDFTLPIGDIFPANGGDGKINSFDVAELLRQWSASPATVQGQSTATDSASTRSSGSSSASGRSADFNKDGVVNSFDFSCLVSSFNQESDPELTPGPVNKSSIGDFCSQATDDNSSNSFILNNTNAPAPTSSTSVTSSTSIAIPSLLDLSLACEGVATEQGNATIHASLLPQSLQENPNVYVWLAVKTANDTYFLVGRHQGDFSHVLDAINEFTDANGKTFKLDATTPYKVQAWLVTYQDNQPISMSLIQEKPLTIQSCQGSPSPSPESTANLAPGTNPLTFTCTQNQPPQTKLTIGNLDGLNTTGLDYNVYIQDLDSSLPRILIGHLTNNANPSDLTGKTYTSSLSDLNDSSKQLSLMAGHRYLLKAYSIDSQLIGDIGAAGTAVTCP